MFIEQTACRPQRMAALGAAQRGLMLALLVVMALVALVGLESCGERNPDAATPALAPPPQTLADLLADHSPEQLRLALCDHPGSPWVVRLEAMRLIRRERPPGGAELLRMRALQSRNDLEQAVALDALVFAYPVEAAHLVPGIMEAFHTEPQDAQRLAVIVLRYHLRECYQTALDALVQASADALFTTRTLILNAGSAILPALHGARPASLGSRLELALLEHALEHASEQQRDGEALSQAGFPEQAVTLYAENYGRLAVPVLQQCLQSDAVAGHGEAAVALADLGEVAAASDIARLLHACPMSAVGERADYLLALGELCYAPALEAVIAASHDDAKITDADHVATWPLAQAALMGLAHCPDDAAHDALIAALSRSEQPAVVVCAANALSQRGDRSAGTALLRAADQLLSQGAKIESDAVIAAQERLMGSSQSLRVILAYVVRYQSAEGNYSVITDQPLLAVDAPGRAVRSSVENAVVSQESLLLMRSDISTAIQLRNSHLLSHLRLGGDVLDDVDMIAR